MPWRYAAVDADLLRNSGEAYLQGSGFNGAGFRAEWAHSPIPMPCSNVCGPMPKYWHNRKSTTTQRTPCRELIVIRGALGVGPQRVVVVVINCIDGDHLHEWREMRCVNCRTSHTPDEWRETRCVNCRTSHTPMSGGRGAARNAGPCTLLAFPCASMCI